ncbi:MAG TPA: [FeFe] hydrogenase H-cluster radical SAM maturase HydG [Syntrophomonadaceae bacterium]|jgi:2-iminoacetate synthase|nr:[FeFe] hydrogenase H-cluster radical SAM maturase HydG [Syntrophomonadaceae bacterium]
MPATSVQEWIQNVIKPEENEKYKTNGLNFIQAGRIEELLRSQLHPEKAYIRDIIAKSLQLERLEPEETAALLNCTDPELWEEMFAAGLKIKQKVYGRRIVTFAPLYISNHCVNSCVYCGFRSENKQSQRMQLNDEQLQAEIKALVEKGHKRLILVYGEHPDSDVHYISHTLEIAYAVKSGPGEIRRCNVNAAPMSIDDLRLLHEAGIGTFQVFQETFHPDTYRRLHPRGIKAHYEWRLYALHRAMEAGVDDVGIGALFGLYDWKYDVMGLLLQSIDLEKHFDGVGPHTISVPRLEPALNTPFLEKNGSAIDDETFKKLVTILRLSVPYTGMILTAREPAEVRQQVIPLGITQIDAGSNIAIGGYHQDSPDYQRQQFILGDNRSLDEAIADLAAMGYITSFCTAGYRCGRTGLDFMGLAKQGKVHNLCMPNAILTFKEYLLDYASPDTQAIGEKLIASELAALPNPKVKEIVTDYLNRIEAGERDLFL